MALVEEHRGVSAYANLSNRVLRVRPRLVDYLPSFAARRLPALVLLLRNNFPTRPRRRSPYYRAEVVPEKSRESQRVAYRFAVVSVSP